MDPSPSRSSGTAPMPGVELVRLGRPMFHETAKNCIKILTMRCDEASLLLSKEQDAPLTAVERWAMSLHLVSCRVCRRYRKQLKLLRGVLGRLSDPPVNEAVASALSSEKQVSTLKNRILQKIKKNKDSL